MRLECGLKMASALKFFSQTKTMDIPIPTKTNCAHFCSAWISTYGGTFWNAFKAWEVEYHEYWSKRLDVPYEPLHPFPPMKDDV